MRRGAGRAPLAVGVELVLGLCLGTAAVDILEAPGNASETFRQSNDNQGIYDYVCTLAKANWFTIAPNTDDTKPKLISPRMQREHYFLLERN